MKLITKILRYNNNKIADITGRTSLLKNVPVFVLLLIALVACRDEVISEPDLPGDNYTDENIATYDLPGIFAVKISDNSSFATRADGDNEDNSSPSDNATFDDGIASEYKLAPGSGYHFVVVYKKGDDAGTPLAVFPLSFTEDPEMNDPAGSNITCYARTVVASKSQDAKLKFASKQALVDKILKNGNDFNEAYVLLNFDCKNVFTGTEVSGGNTESEAAAFSIDASKSNAANLFALTRAEFLSLPLKDYKITVNNTDYFTMSNSVYADATFENVQADYKIDADIDKIYDSEDEAKSHLSEPVVSARVERLAVKYTVNFKDGYSSDPTTGLPQYPVKINIYSGITYTKDGYSINSDEKGATIHVLGYAVNDTEKSSYLLKKLSANKNYFIPVTSLSTTKSWTDPNNFRSYWAEDPHYSLEKNTGDDAHYKSAKGYPQQFRQALEVDSILQFHGVNKDPRRGYIWDEEPEVTVERNIYRIDENGDKVFDHTEPVVFYKSLGRQDNTSFNDKCVLRYWSFDEMQKQYAKLTATDGVKPFYSLENTYYDPGMKTGNTEGSTWVWNWRKAPYSVATNLTLLCEMTIDETTGTGETKPTLYRGQNNVYYNSEESLLESKLEIFNKVILSQGNAGINVFHAFFASHGFLSTGEDDFHGTNTSLEKVAWNRGSVLWICEDVEDNGEETKDAREMTANDLRLIPAEIAGGDGQCLIAPKMMGPNYRFYLAPILKDENDNPIKESGEPVKNGEPVYRDRKNSVEISFNHLVALFHKSIGPIDVFTEGKMYYTIPIPHRVKSLIMDGNEPHWKTLANIGVVRNNWYDITVSSITGVGTPVHDVTQPIVPVMEVVRSYINANIQVYGWHVLTQENLPMQ